MGNDASVGCRLGRRIDTVTSCCYTLYEGLGDEGKPPLSVFVYDIDDNNQNYVEHAAKLLKILRHPGIISFHSLSLATPKTVWLITERVVPLPVVLDALTSTEICSGLYNIIEALAFLHDRGGICHNNVSAGSVFVAVDGTWKLGGFECACVFKDATQVFLLKQKRLRPFEIIAPEEKTGREFPVDMGHCRDVYAFGLFAVYILEYLSSLGTVVKRFELRIQEECLNEDPQLRPRLHTLLEDQLFRNDFVEIINFLKKITMKSAEEKKLFFSTVVSRLYSLPEELVASRLIKLLISRFVLLEPYACQFLLPHLLTPRSDEKIMRNYDDTELNPVIGESRFKQYLIPELFKIFHVRDAHVRKVLLTHFHRYLRLFDMAVLAEVIFPQILLSVRDTNDELVVLSLRAISDLVPVLGGDTVIGADRIKLFSEGIPRSVATNGFVERQSNGSAITSKSALQSPRKDVISADRQKQREESKRRILERRKKREEERQKGSNSQTELANDSHDSDLMTHNDYEVTEAADYNTRSGAEESHRIEVIDNDNDILHDDTPSYTDDAPMYTEPTDSEIELEIQEELCALGSNPSTPKHVVDRTDKSDKCSIIERIDWSDANSHGTNQQPSNSFSGLRGALKLSTNKTVDNSQNNGAYNKAVITSSKNAKLTLGSNIKQSTRQASTNVSVNNNSITGYLSQNRLPSKDLSPVKLSNDWDDNDWESLDTQPLSPMAHHKSVGTESVKKSAVGNLTRQTSDSRTVKSNPNQQLGLEFDIKMIDVKPVASKQGDQQFDFFADMAPQIKPIEKGEMAAQANAKAKSIQRAEERVTPIEIAKQTIEMKSENAPNISPAAEKRSGERTQVIDKSTFDIRYNSTVDEGAGWDVGHDEEIDEL